MISLIKSKSYLEKYPNSFIVYESRRIMIIYYYILDKRTFFTFKSFEYIDNEKMLSIINIFNNKMIKNEKIISLAILKDDIYLCEDAFKRNMYYEKGRYVQRKVEEYRYLIKDEAFDNEGFIINQSLIDSVPLGKFKTSNKGCGWIACYNLFKLMGYEKTMKEVSSDMSEIVLFKGLLGIDVFGMFNYLKKQKIDVYLTPIFKNQCIREIKKSKYGIILYIHNRGSHYVTYKNLNNGQCIYYNAVYGKSNHVLNIEEFYKKYSITPFGMLISI
ncbi:MAG: hypothetical protein GX675_00735 [Erysipelotrichaceae bacterium]|nr:hypothetical protein [Erysipelotrichaceae bacterium]